MSVADRWGEGDGSGGHASLGPVRTSHKNMDTKDAGIDFMFLALFPHLAGRSATVCTFVILSFLR